MKIENLAAEVNKILDDYSEATFDVVQAATDKVAKEAVAELKTTSPRDRGDYAQSWRQRRKNSKERKYSRIAYNEKHYRLTHLLEYGHALHQGGRAEAHPHIAKVEEKAVTEFERLIVEGIEKI